MGDGLKELWRKHAGEAESMCCRAFLALFSLLLPCVLELLEVTLGDSFHPLAFVRVDAIANVVLGPGRAIVTLQGHTNALQVLP